MVKPLVLLFKAARPRQSLKNLSLFTGLIFSGWLFSPAKFWTTVAAFVIFSLLTGSVYIFNDIVDLESDKKHPFKKKRPLASGRLSLPLALFVSLTGFFVSLSLGWGLSFFLFLGM